MSTQRWPDTLIRERVKAKMRKYQEQGAELLAAEAIAYSAVCEDMRNEYEVELASLRELLDNLRTAAHAGGDDLAGEVLRLRAELDATRVALRNTTMALIEMHAEYKSLWDEAIAFINAPKSNTLTEYSALMQQVRKSRFWSKNA